MAHCREGALSDKTQERHVCATLVKCSVVVEPACKDVVARPVFQRPLFAPGTLFSVCHEFVVCDVCATPDAAELDSQGFFRLGARDPSLAMLHFLCRSEKDKVMGMFCAHSVGDALLAPYEDLPGNRNRPGDFEERITESTCYKRTNRFGHYCEYAAGQGTDDSDMTRILLEHVVQGRGRLDKALILSYVRWANSGTESLGSNTRRLLHGFKRLETYKKRFAKVFGDEAAREGQQSNGHLMRCCPLALIDDPETRKAAIHFDCGITNPSSVCLEATTIYLDVLRALLRSTDSDAAVIERLVAPRAAEARGPLKQALLDGLCPGPFPRKMTGKYKCWTLNSLSAALYFARTSVTFADGMRSVVELGGDTDTNGCILGALLGARFGLGRMQEEALVGNFSCGNEACRCLCFFHTLFHSFIHSVKDATAHNMKMVLACKASVLSRTRDGPEKFSLRPEEYSMKTMLSTLENNVRFYPESKRARTS